MSNIIGGVATIDLGEVGQEDWDPGVLAVSRERGRRGLVLLLLAVTVLCGASAAVPIPPDVHAVTLADLADADGVVIDGDVAVGVLPDSGEVVAVSLAGGRLRWRHDPGFDGRPTVQIADGQVILDTGAGTPRTVSIVDLTSGREMVRVEGSTVTPAIAGVQAVRQVDETGSTVRALGPAGGWVAAWPPESVPIPVYAQGRRAPAVVAMRSDGLVRRLDLIHGTWTDLGRVELGDIPLGLFDGRLQVRQDRGGSGYIALYDSAGGELTSLWRDRLSGSDPPRLIPCGVYLCGGIFGSTTAYAPADGRVAWEANRFRITAGVDGPGGSSILAGVVTDIQGRSQEALADAADGRLLTILGPWRLGAVLGGRAYLYRSGIAGRAWLGEIDLGSPQPRVRTTLHLPMPAQSCDFSERWAVCLTGVAGQPPYAVPLT